MSHALRQYHATHGGAGSPLVVLEQAVRSRGAPDPARISSLADETGLPSSAVRSALSYYTDLGQTPGADRVCRGTSCVLAGAADAPGRPVYCLGYCDRSPAVLRADGRVVLGAPPRGDPAPGTPDIRCAAAQPIVTRRAGRGDFAGLGAARGDGAYGALEVALGRAPHEIVEAIERSGERGRGGAAFPMGTKWRRAAAADGPRKYAVANGDEGDPGSFIDRVLMELDPHSVLEGLAICGYAVGASHGIVFVRSEYPAAVARMRAAVAAARDAGILGASVLGSGFAFDATVVTGMGSYVCGEETAMLNAIEGLRGEVRLRPPYPTERGLYGMPTVVNNVESLVNVPWIVEHGAGAFAALGTDGCSGTKAMCLNHGFARPGIVEVEFGTPLRAVIEDAGHGGGGPRAGSLEAVILGGPMGSVLDPSRWDVPVCYDAMARSGIQLGHGGVVAIPGGADLDALLVHLLEFMQHESCGKCVPCRVGSLRALELARGRARRPALEPLLAVIAEGSLCAFGREMPRPLGELLALSEGRPS